jgi:uncharacterized membrane protein SpoIIM required for sporulation
MDLDAYAAVHQPAWRRLEELSARRRLTGAEADEFTALYQEVATHLSVIRSGAPDAGVIGYLSALLAQARTRTGGARTGSVAGLVHWLTRRLPAALYRARAWWLTTMLASYAVATVMTAWLLQHPQVESAMLTPEQVGSLVHSDFEGYYSQAAAGDFAAKVWTNNAYVAALCVAFGVFGLPVLWVLAQNLLNLAVMASVMIRHDRGDLFFGLVLPHGLLELTAVFVAAGTGLRLMWAWVAPGPETRARSLAAQGRAAAAVVLGLAGVLFVSGLIEGFVTPSGLPTWARIGIGVVAEAAFLLYVFVVGRNAVRAGETGDLDRRLLEDTVAVSA